MIQNYVKRVTDEVKERRKLLTLLNYKYLDRGQIRYRHLWDF
jgi:hypothetical protein